MQATVKTKMDRVQMLRGIVFLTIFVFHCNVPFSNILWGGIECFFLLSSFFLTRKLWRTEKISVKSQFWHRIQRLSLPYICVLVLAALRSILFRENLYDFIPHLVFGQNFLWMVTRYTSSMQPLTAHLWTMSIEVWMGFLWLVLLKVLPKPAWRKAMYACLACSVALRTWLIFIGYDTLVLSLSPLSHMDAFAVGSLLAIQLEEDSQKKVLTTSWIAGVLGVLGIVASWLCLMKAHNLSLLNAYRSLNNSDRYLANLVAGNLYLYFALVFYWLIAGVGLKDIYGKAASANWLGRVLKYLGDTSYVMYLFHWPILWFLKLVWSKLPWNEIKPWPMLLIVGILLTVAATFIFERYIAPLFKKLKGGK